MMQIVQSKQVIYYKMYNFQIICLEKHLKCIVRKNCKHSNQQLFVSLPSSLNKNIIYDLKMHLILFLNALQLLAIKSFSY